MSKQQAFMALALGVVVASVSASAFARAQQASELRRDLAEAAFGRQGGQQPPPGGPPQGRGGRGGGGPRGAEPLVMDDQAGFQPIFDGKTLNGWEGDPAFWKVEGGAIVGQSTPTNAVKENTFIIWRGGEPANFELKVQFRMNATNSGIQIRSVHLPQGTKVGDRAIEGKWVLKGYQADIDFNNQFT